MEAHRWKFESHATKHNPAISWLGGRCSLIFTALWMVNVGMNTIEYSIHSASGVLWICSQLFVSFQVEEKNTKQQSSKNPSVGFHDHWSHAVAYSSLPTESDRTHGTKDSDPFGRRVVLLNHYENRNHKKSTYFAGVAPQSKISQRSTVCWKI